MNRVVMAYGKSFHGAVCAKVLLETRSLHFSKVQLTCTNAYIKKAIFTKN